MLTWIELIYVIHVYRRKTFSVSPALTVVVQNYGAQGANFAAGGIVRGSELCDGGSLVGLGKSRAWIGNPRRAASVPRKAATRFL